MMTTRALHGVKHPVFFWLLSPLQGIFLIPSFRRLLTRYWLMDRWIHIHTLMVVGGFSSLPSFFLLYSPPSFLFPFFFSSASSSSFFIFFIHPLSFFPFSLFFNFFSSTFLFITFSLLSSSRAGRQAYGWDMVTIPRAQGTKVVC